MKIKANNIEDFETQYYKQVGNNSLLETIIYLSTSDDFWDELVKIPLENAKSSISFLKDNLINTGENYRKDLTSNNFKQVFEPKYGIIKRVL